MNNSVFHYANSLAQRLSLIDNLQNDISLPSKYDLFDILTLIIEENDILQENWIGENKWNFFPSNKIALELIFNLCLKDVCRI